MYTVSGMNTRKQFETLEEAVMFRDDNPAIQIFEEDGYGNVTKVSDANVNRITLQIMEHKKVMQAKTMEQPKVIEQNEVKHNYDKPEPEADKHSRIFKILMLVFMSLILIYVTWRIMGEDVLSLFRNIGELVVILL